MLSGLIIATLALFGTIAFNASYAFSGVSSAYLGLYKGIIERNVYVAGEDGNYAPTPYIDLAGLESDLNDYFLANLSPYCRDYSYEVRGRARRFSGYTDAVRINLSVQLTLTWHRDYTAVFAIERND